MKILVLGGTGMLGSGLVRWLAPRHAVAAAVRREACPTLPEGVKGYAGIDVADGTGVRRLLAEVEPDVVVNAVGIVKQIKGVGTESFVTVNAAFPHRLARMVEEEGGHLIHVSTDCVFSGSKGGYRESDAPDPVDMYGMSKLLGEPDGDGATVIRTSMIGLETPQPGRAPHGLVEWALRRDGPIEGYQRAVFSGLTVTELSRAIETIALAGGLRGLWHVAANPVSKHDLLAGLAARLPERGMTVRPAEGPAIDRSLDGTRFARASGFRAPSWDAMLDDLAQDIRTRGEAGA